MREKTPNKSYYSVQISFREHELDKEPSETKPHDFVRKAKASIELLSNDVRKYRRECAEHEAVLQLARKHGDGLGQKVGQLKQQLEIILQQNATLKAAKEALANEVETTIKEKARLERTKKRAREERKNAAEEVRQRASSGEKRHKKIMETLDKREKQQLGVKELLEQKIEKARDVLAELVTKREKATKESERTSKEFVQEVDILSHIITIS